MSIKESIVNFRSSFDSCLKSHWAKISDKIIRFIMEIIIIYNQENSSKQSQGYDLKGCFIDMQ